MHVFVNREKFVGWIWNAKRDGEKMKRSRSVVITKKKKKKGSAMLTFQKRQSHRGKSRSSGIKTEVRYHVCACMCGNPCTDGPIFFFFSVTNVAIKLLKRSNCCTKKRMAVRISRQNISNVHYPYIWYSINEMIIYIFVITTYWIFARVYSNCQ